MKELKELRFINRELRVQTTDGKTTLTGYAAVFDSLSYDLGGFREKLSKGAFTRSIKNKADVMALSEHDSKKGILGRTKSNTLRLSEDNIGLRFEVDLPNTQLGRDVAESVSRGDLDGCSFGFVAKEQNWDRTGKEVVRSLSDVDLYDISVVGQPAYPSTSVSLRSLYPDGVAEVPAEFRADAKTKKVAGEDLHADDFIIVGDPDKTDTWKLPWHFSTDEKTKSHLRNALARFDQLQGVGDKAAAKTKLMRLAKDHGIDASSDRSMDDIDPFASSGTCDCNCDGCGTGDCQDCTDVDCNDANCWNCPAQEADTMRLLAKVIESRLKAV